MEENKKRQALLREKEKYEKLSPEEKEKRLLYGLYNYWSLPIIDTTDDDDLIETEYYII